MPMKKIRYCTAALAALLLLAPIQTQASAPYYSYNETSWSTEAAAPDSYLPEEQYTGIMLGSGPLSAPEDFCFDDQGNVYIADTGNNRIVIADAQFRFVGEIREVHYINAAETGCWYPCFHAGDQVGEGELLGVVRDFFGNELESCRAVCDGVILYQTSSLNVLEGGPMIAYGALESQE